MNKEYLRSLAERLKTLAIELENVVKEDVESYEWSDDDYTEILKYYEVNDDDGEEVL
jgi:hypothetical protein